MLTPLEAVTLFLAAIGTGLGVFALLTAAEGEREFDERLRKLEAPKENGDVLEAYKARDRIGKERT